MHPIFQFLLIVFVLAVPSPIIAQQPRPPLVFSNVTVIDCTGAPAQPDMTVVITGDRITGLGKTGKAAIPVDALIIDASGKFMIPGLWDMHVHTTSRTAGLFLANGVLGMRVMWGKPTHLTDRERAGELGNRYDGADNPSFSGTLFSGIQLEGTPSLPFLRSSVASSIIDGPEPMWQGSLAVDTADQARQVVRNFKMQGYDFLKVYSRLSRSVYLAIADEANRVGIRFVGHVPYAISAAEASDAGQATIEHLTGIYMACSSAEEELHEQVAKLNFQYPVGLREARAAYDPAKAQALFRRFAKNETWQVPTLTVLRWRAFADSTELTQDERLRYLSPIQTLGWRHRAQGMASSSEIDLAMLRRDFEQDMRTVGEMHKAGVRILAGTDTANPFCLPGFGLHDELELLVLAGLSPMQALQAATRSPAEYLGRLKDLGTVEPGKFADLVLLDADPLDDINHVRNISSVVFAGNYFSGEQLDEILAERELEHAIVELAESFSREKLQALAGDRLIHHVRRLRIQDAVYRVIQIRMHPQLGEENGEDATLLFQHMPNLEELFLNNTNFNDLGLSRLKTLNKLKTLEAGSTRVTNQGLTHLGQLPALQLLDLSDTKVTDAGVRHLTAVPNLSQLSLAETDISDAGLQHLQQLKSLTSLDLINTTVSLDGVEQFKRAIPHCDVSISSTPQLTVNLVQPTRDAAFFEKGSPVLLKAKIRATIGAEVSRVEFLVDGATIAVKQDFPFEFLWEDAPAGRHLVTVRVVDDARAIDVASSSTAVYVGIHGMESVIMSSTDDVEEAEDGSMHTGRPNLHFARDGTRGFQVVGLRFDNIAIPQGAKITRAFAQFTADGAGKATTKLVIRAQRSPNARTFNQDKCDVSSRLTTDSSVDWSPPQWMQKSEQSEKQRTSDLSRIIQEVVSHDEWKTGNALALVIAGRGYRNAVAYDSDPNAAARLYVEYEP